MICFFFLFFLNDIFFYQIKRCEIKRKLQHGPNKYSQMQRLLSSVAKIRNRTVMKTNQNNKDKNVKRKQILFSQLTSPKDLFLSNQTMPFCLHNYRFFVKLNSNRTLPCPIRQARFTSLTVQSRATISSEPAMASNSVRVAAAQMTSINDLAANFATCSRLVKVNSLLISH